MKIYSIAAIGFLITCILAGCVTVERKDVLSTFDPSELASYKLPGTARITGQAFLKTRGGDVKLAAGETVTLTPAIPAIKEIRTLRDHGILPIYPESWSDAIVPTTRKTIVDAQGNFEFSGLPPGEYLLEVLIKWTISSAVTTGGMVTKYVVVKEGTDQRVMLTE